MRSPRPKQRRRTGAAAAELAVFLPVLAIMILGCVDFGRFAYSYIALSNATRSGAFYAVMNPYRGSAQQVIWLAAIQTNARQEMLTGGDTNLTIDQTALTANTGNTVFSNRDVIVTIESNGERRVSVTAHYPFKPLISFPGMPGTISMQRNCQMRSIR